MAIRIPTDDSTPSPEGPKWQAGEGMTISTVRVRQTADAYVAVEHPADMSDADLSTALGNRRGDIAAKASWWGPSRVTEVVEVVPQANDPDDTYSEPIAIRAADTEAPAPVAVVTDFSEEAV
jgi:hypothetical protein